MPKILIIDDEKMIRERLKNNLELDDYEVALAEDGPHGLECFSEFKPDVILLDIRLPGINGIELYKTNKDLFKDTEVIFITGHGGVETAIDALKYGAFGYLQKPLDYDELIIEIQRALEKKHLKLKLDSYVQDLEHAKEAAEAGSRIKSEFLAKMSHEIRTPMNGVIGFLTLLDATPLSEIQKEYIKDAQFSADALMTLINDILDFSKIEAGKMDLEMIPFNPRALIENVVINFSPMAYNKNLNLSAMIKPPFPESLMGDPGRMRQILMNLINNAIKFTEKGEINLIAEVRNETEDLTEIYIEVSDTGIGIAADDLNKLFQLFSQVDSSTTRKYGGTGLGLAISQKLVEAFGGKINIKSELGKGSTFSFTIKFRKNKVPEKSEDHDISLLKGKRIFVVDDNDLNRKIFNAYLTEWGCHLQEARDGEEALKILNQSTEKIDAILVDYLMPKMDGAELAKLIKSDEKFRDIPLVCITSVPRRGDVRLNSEVHFSGYLTKPIRKDELRDCLGLVLSIYTPKNINQEKPLVTSHLIRETREKQKYSILVAEDNKINQKLVVKILQKFGYKADIVDNGLEALNILKKQKYDLVLMDCQMPVMNGYEASRKIREIHKDLPKEVGTATGLGLSISYGIIQNHKGEIILASNQNPTIFKVILQI